MLSTQWPNLCSLSSVKGYLHLSLQIPLGCICSCQSWRWGGVDSLIELDGRLFQPVWMKLDLPPVFLFHLELKRSQNIPVMVFNWYDCVIGMPRTVLMILGGLISYLTIYRSITLQIGTPSKWVPKSKTVERDVVFMKRAWLKISSSSASIIPSSSFFNQIKRSREKVLWEEINNPSLSQLKYSKSFLS